MRLPRFRTLLRLFGVALLLAAALLAWMVHLSRAMPVVRETTVTMDYPADVEHRPVRIALISDTHVSSARRAARLDRIIDLINAQKPDLVLMGGDYIGDPRAFEGHYPHDKLLPPFKRLKAPMGVVAVLGNHDVIRATHNPPPELKRGFAPAGITLLVNGAIRKGPLVIGGVDDFYEGRIDIPRTRAAMRRRGGVPVMLAHTPDIFPMLDKTTPLLLAGHTHCGQVALPFWGAIYVPAQTGTRYACGRYDQDGRTLVVSAGTGTSGLPIRLFAPPDLWIVTITPRGK